MYHPEVPKKTHFSTSSCCSTEAGKGETTDPVMQSHADRQGKSASMIFQWGLWTFWKHLCTYFYIFTLGWCLDVLKLIFSLLQAERKFFFTKHWQKIYSNIWIWFQNVLLLIMVILHSCPNLVLEMLSSWRIINSLNHSKNKLCTCLTRWEKSHWCLFENFCLKLLLLGRI